MGGGRWRWEWWQVLDLAMMKQDEALQGDPCVGHGIDVCACAASVTRMWYCRKQGGPTGASPPAPTLRNRTLKPRHWCVACRHGQPRFRVRASNTIATGTYFCATSGRHPHPYLLQCHVRKLHVLFRARRRIVDAANRGVRGSAVLVPDAVPMESGARRQHDWQVQRHDQSLVLALCRYSLAAKRNCLCVGTLACTDLGSTVL